MGDAAGGAGGVDSGRRDRESEAAKKADPLI
jgi:hypothetical protein